MTLADLHRILARIAFRDWTLRAGFMGEGYFVQVRFCARDASAVRPTDEREWSGRKWYVSSHATTDEVVMTCLKAVLTAVEHEAREDFRYRGVAVFQPHISVEQLVTIAGERVLRDPPTAVQCEVEQDRQAHGIVTDDGARARHRNVHGVDRDAGALEDR